MITISNVAAEAGVTVDQVIEKVEWLGYDRESLSGASLIGEDEAKTVTDELAE